jgi:hypothetical protein
MWSGNNDSVMHPPQEHGHDYQYHQAPLAQAYEHMYEPHGGDMNIGMDFSQSLPQPCGHIDMHPGMQQQYNSGLDTLFEPSSYGGGDMGQVPAVDYQYNDMVHEYH